ncbi:uncharacterized protein LOC106877999 [Octopus bimaculoides]|uniref:uncharacterized protein LOC106877999 n=1 Tax=Octopus bimaculoides TaxID=37653 RepID=UPI00071E17CF|nr:uncharacterized protein LOC106877999 [Octopus bimaculoides]|eukprot:XP_014782559.1 PREDICTED: uncharacterized protein LOC106877999 [Octopus bimaculoides]
MSGEEIAIGTILLYSWKEKTECKGSSKKKLMMWKALELLANAWFKIGSDVSKKVTPASKRNPSQGDLLWWKMRPYLKWLNNSQAQVTRALLAGLGSSQSTVSRHLHKLGLVNRCCRDVPHELTNDQIQRRMNICQQPQANP